MKGAFPQVSLPNKLCAISRLKEIVDAISDGGIFL